MKRHTLFVLFCMITCSVTFFSSAFVAEAAAKRYPELSLYPLAPASSSDADPSLPPSPNPPVKPDEPAKKQIAAIEAYPAYGDALATVQGSSIHTIASYFKDSPVRLSCYDTGGEEYEEPLTVQWDLSSIDPSAVGLYSAIGSVTAPDDYEFVPEIQLPLIVIPVSVQAEGRPDINCFFTGRGSFRFPYVTPPCPPSEMSAWISENGGEWQEVNARCNTDMLILNSNLLTSGSSYRLQMDYTGGSTGILSFTYDDSIVISNYSEGNRDGGDSTEPPSEPPLLQKPPQPPALSGDDDEDGYKDSSNSRHDLPSPLPLPLPTAENKENQDSDNQNLLVEQTTVSQENTAPVSPVAAPSVAAPSVAARPTTVPPTTVPPVPAPPVPAPPAPAPPAPASPAPMEEITADKTTISGTRLTYMIQNYGETIPFEHHGISVSIPSSFFKPLAISAEQYLSVEIVKGEGNSFTIKLWLDGREIPVPDGTKVSYLLNSDDIPDTLSLNGHKTDTQVITKDGIASFYIKESGTYLLTDSRKDNAWDSLPSPVLPATCAIAVGCGLLIKRKGLYKLWKLAKNRFR